MTRLGDYSGRDNNFNLIRFVAAALVIWTHAFALVAHPQPSLLERVFGLSPGALGVDIFFVLSGFLVAKSLDGKTLAEFIWARCVRIYPALWASIAVSVLLAGLLFSDEPTLSFLMGADTLRYLVRNATLLSTSGAQVGLAHAFPYVGGRFNLSLWTLPYELGMYGLLAVLGMSFGLRARYVIVLAALGMTARALLHDFGSAGPVLAPYARFLYMFFAGAAAYALRNRIVLRNGIALGLVCAIAAAVALTHGHYVREGALMLALPYLLLWLGLAPGGLVRQWNRLGDYSYGMYIYACPVQVALFSMGATTTGAGNFIITMLITLPIAVISWHALEKSALRIRPPAFLADSLARRAPAVAD